MPASVEHLASLCGLEKALNKEDQNAVSQSINKILMMQALSFLSAECPCYFMAMSWVIQTIIPIWKTREKL
jgi:hypothetical protein